MTRKRTPNARTLRVKVKDNKVTITFNAQNWNPAHSELLDFLASRAESRKTPVAEYMGEAISLLGRKHASSQEDFELVMRTCEKLSAHESENTREFSNAADSQQFEP